MKFKPTPHPIFKLPEPELLEAMGPEKAAALLDRRERMIEEELRDPFTKGYEPPQWAKADELLVKQKLRQTIGEEWIMGGNRASKSEYAAKKVLKVLLAKPRRRGWAFSESAPNSREMLQPIIWKYLPPHLKELNHKRATIANISYTQKMGFTENALVLPNGSQLWFRNYEQDDKTIEGGELDIIWFDELVPINFVETCRYRLVTRGGDMIVTFTAIKGYTPTVKSILDGARTIETREAPLLPLLGDSRDIPLHGRDKITGRPIMGFQKLPTVQLSKDGKAYIIYFWTQDNPFGNYASLMEVLEGKSDDEIKTRAYGIPTKAIAARFEIFNDTVHVVRHEIIPADGTNFQLVDPCGGRTWASLWLRICAGNYGWIYREWPDQDQYIEGVGFPGEWALPDGKLADGRKGPAQAGFRFGIRRYKEEFERLESGEHERWLRTNPKTGKPEPEVIYERYMDSRYGHATTVGKDDPVTLIEECEEEGLYFLPTPGKGIDDGIDILNKWLEYDVRRPIDGTNQPHLRISERCKNFIYALHTWTGADGKNGATKDWIDLGRYGVLINPQNVEGEALAVRPGNVN